MISTPRQWHRKAPRKDGVFSWSVIYHVDIGMLDYRLFRRDVFGALHSEMRTFRVDTARSDIARLVWAMRIRLRERVDEICFRQLGVTA